MCSRAKDSSLVIPRLHTSHTDTQLDLPPRQPGQQLPLCGESHRVASQRPDRHDEANVHFVPTRCQCQRSSPSSVAQAL